MLDLFGWDVGMTGVAALMLVLGALILGAIAQIIGRVVVGYEWIFTALAALVGGWIGSEALGTLSTWGPEFEGLYVLPALVGGIVLGGLVDIVVRRSTGGHYLEPRPI
ncbi:MAG: GlsB/YeaQ/YmgE family stress response membrane protein [Chloroflexota bacterium]